MKTFFANEKQHKPDLRDQFFFLSKTLYYLILPPTKKSEKVKLNVKNFAILQTEAKKTSKLLRSGGELEFQKR